ncbi:hypothetical protein N9J84_01560 [Porticoccaceae bacterium]|nr:hypothetical protein [Porticoccaceae bacterium]
MFKGVVILILSGAAFCGISTAITGDPFLPMFFGVMILVFAVKGFKRLYKEDGFVRGEEDCKAGKPHLEGQCREYDAGYGEQYSKEQVNDKRTDR